MCAYSSLVRFLLVRSPSKSLLMDYNQTWVKAARGVSSFFDKVKGHIPRSTVI